MSNRVLIALVGALLMAMPSAAFASKGKMMMSSSSDEGGGHRGARQEMLMDLSVHYVRDTQPDGATDTAARFSIGGMFNEWIGLDVLGMYQARSKNYLVGSDIRLVPNDWFFLKGGLGGYARKTTNELALTPIAGAGIMARLGRDYYMLTEASYFTVNDRNNISFGVGLGVSF